MIKTVTLNAGDFTKDIQRVRTAQDRDFNTDFDRLVKAKTKQQSLQRKQSENRRDRTDDNTNQSGELKRDITKKNSPKPVKAEKTDDTSEPVVAADEKKREEIVEAVANVLDIPPETIVQLLNALGINPEDLADTQIANEFLQMLMGIQSAAQLLTMPEYQPLLEAVTSTVNQILADQNTFAGQMLNAQAEMDTANQQSAGDSEESVQQTSGRAENEGESADSARTRGESRIDRLSEGTRRTGNEHDNLRRDIHAHIQQEAEIEPVSQMNAPGMIETQAAVRTQTATAASAAVDPADIMQQIVTHVRAQSGENFSEIRLTLRPESLGDVSLRVAMQNGIVTAMFVAENQRIREIIEANLNQLRDVLQQQGIQISQLSVSVGQDDAQERMNQFLRAQQNESRRMQRILRTTAVDDGEAEQQSAVPDVYADNVIDYRA